MISSLFGSSTRVCLLFLFLVGFGRLTIIPSFLSAVNNTRLLVLIMFFIIISFGTQSNNVGIKNRTVKFYIIMMGLLAFFIVLNCYSCWYFRGQPPIETFRNWAPILILYLYYPFSKIEINVKKWEEVLFVIFLFMLIAHIVQTIIPSWGLFPNDTSDEIFENQFRVRLFSDTILFLGNIYCFNRSMIEKNNGRYRYLILFLVSLFFIFLMGFRTILFALLVVCFFIYVKISKQKLKKTIITLCVSVPLVLYVTSLPIFQERFEEIIERNSEQNFSNNDYVRVVMVNYYYSSYFKNNTEMICGSGMVERLVGEKNSNYRSAYSKFVSENSIKFHFFPVDMGLIGLSWESGIPAAIILFLICLYLAIHKQEDKYIYVQAWGIFVMLMSFTTHFYYCHHNLLYTVLVWIIFSKFAHRTSLSNQIKKECQLRKIAKS